jgi:hypothetical protein
MKEIWKVIPGWEYYQVSNKGRVKSFMPMVGRGKNATHKSLKLSEGIILKPRKIKQGYVGLTLCSKERKELKGKYVHRLVMLAFKGDSKLQVNHKNGIKDDNRLENLEYCTGSENTRHSYNNGFQKTKLSEEKVREIRKIKGTIKRGTLALIAEKYGCAPGTIWGIRNKVSWRHLED